MTVASYKLWPWRDTKLLTLANEMIAWLPDRDQGIPLARLTTWMIMAAKGPGGAYMITGGCNEWALSIHLPVSC
jgi:hypothetical protein